MKKSTILKNLAGNERIVPRAGVEVSRTALQLHSSGWFGVSANMLKESGYKSRAELLKKVSEEPTNLAVRVTHNNSFLLPYTEEAYQFLIGVMSCLARKVRIVAEMHDGTIEFFGIVY